VKFAVMRQAKRANSMPKPLIGIICGPYDSLGVPTYGVRAAYTKAVAMSGGSPILIAPNIGDEALRDIYERLDGILLAGGGDVDPIQYGMTDDGLVYGVSRDRDNAEIKVTRWTVDEDRPLLGICRGCQVINVALGGTLYRDIPTEYAGYNGIHHDQADGVARNRIAHGVDVQPTSRLASIIGENKSPVNSLHHQSVRDVASRLQVSAVADDGVIEGVEIPDARFFVAVQWHPEELVEQSEPMRRLFDAFVRAAQHG
jgi:putative glutamine amidotransferase